MAEIKYEHVRVASLGLTRQECEDMLAGIGIHCRETDSLYILQRAVTEAVMDGDLLCAAHLISID